MPTTVNAAPDHSSKPCKKRLHDNVLQLETKKSLCATGTLVYHGRHFGRSIHAFYNTLALITSGSLRLGERSEEPEEAFTAEERREHKMFCSLLKTVPGLEERIVTAGSEEDIQLIATLLQEGVSNARSEDTKSLKLAIVDWLLPPGQSPIPPLAPNLKKNARGFNHNVTGALLCPAGVDWSNKEIKQKLRTGGLTVAGNQWPIFLYKAYRYDDDDPWRGLLRSQVLIKTFRHIFTSPSSVEKEAKAARLGNARIHGTIHVTPASLAYAATQARFTLSSTTFFSRTNTVTDSERFYNMVLDLLEDPNEIREVDSLLAWWNR